MINIKRPKTGTIFFVMVDSEDFPSEGVICIENEEENTMEVQGRIRNLILCRVLSSINRELDSESRNQFETRLKVKIGEL